MPLEIVGIAGSLRAGSYNRALLRAAAEVAPAGMRVEIADLRPLPLYDGDTEAAGLPPAVAELKARVRAADALLVVTPEYNYSVPGVLKNALDWLSRGADSALVGRAAGIMGASPGGFGTVRAQHHLRQVAAGANLLVMTRPEVHVAHAADKFDREGRLTDDATRRSVSAFLAALGAWAELHRRSA